MSRLLDWREAQRDDRPLLQAFACTRPAPKTGFRRRPAPHPRRWERRVEAGIRNLHPPIGGGLLLLGEDDLGLAAVALLLFEESGRVVKLAAVAVACRHRGGDGRYADEALDVALSAAADHGHGLGHPVVSVYGLVAPQNQPSRDMNARAGLRHLLDEEDGLERWVIELEAPPGLLKM